MHLINECTGSDIVIPEGEEVVNMCEGLEGYANGVAKREVSKTIVDSIENIMRNLEFSLETACNAIGFSVQEYEEAKALLNK